MLIRSGDLTGMKTVERPNHVPLERIWSFIYDNLELAAAEQRHLNLCLYCADVFRLCVTSENFDRMMQEIGENGQERSTAA